MILNEIHWTIVSSTVPIMELFIMGYCLYLFAKPFIESSCVHPLPCTFYKGNNKEKKNKKRTCYVGITYTLTMLILYKIPIHFSTFAAYSIGVFTAFLVMCLIEQRNYEQKIFIVVTFFSLRWFTSAMAEILYDNLYDFLLNTNYMKMHPDMSFVLYVMVCVLYLALEFLFTAIGIRCILKNYAYKVAEMSKKELWIININIHSSFNSINLAILTQLPKQILLSPLMQWTRYYPSVGYAHISVLSSFYPLSFSFIKKILNFSTEPIAIYFWAWYHKNR